MVKIIGDRVIIKYSHRKKAKKIIPNIIKQYFHNKLIICIGGESGIGKTEIACCLQDLLWEQHRIRTKTLHIDDFYFTDWQNRNKIRKQKGMSSVGICEIDWKKINKTIIEFRTNKKYINTQRINRYTNSVEFVKVLGKNIDILIFEGLYTNHLKEKDLGIYLEGSIKDTESFRKERGKEVINKFRNEVLKREMQEVTKTKKLANLVIPFKI